MPPTLETYHPMYGGSRIQLYYLPYINQIAVLENVDKREAENRLCERIGVPRIGQGWVNETELYRLIRSIYPNHVIEREASPDFLEGQRFDIYFPHEGVVVEYQGEQHEYPVERFGGANGHKRIIERDREKRKKAKLAGVYLVEFWYYEKIDEKMVMQRLDPYLS